MKNLLNYLNLNSNTRFQVNLVNKDCHFKLKGILGWKRFYIGGILAKIVITRVSELSEIFG